MKGVFAIAVSALALAACSQKPPECGDQKTVDALKKSFGEEAAKFVPEIMTPILYQASENSTAVHIDGKYEETVTLLGKIKPEGIAGKIPMSVENIRTAGFDKDIGKYSCEADVSSTFAETPGVYFSKASMKNPVKYNVQLTSDKSIHVEISAMDKELAKQAADNTVRIEVSAVEKKISKAASLCSEGETVLFSCRSGIKTASVCASNNLSAKDGYMQYRFGRPEAIELSFPEPKQHPSKFSAGGNIMLVGGGGSYLRMKNGEHDYIAYFASGREADLMGVSVESGGKPVAHVECDIMPSNVQNFGSADFEKYAIPEDKSEFYLP